MLVSLKVSSSVFSTGGPRPSGGPRSSYCGLPIFSQFVKNPNFRQNFHKNYKSQHYDLQKHLEAKNGLTLTQLKVYNKQKMFKRFMEGRKMLQISL